MKKPAWSVKAASRATDPRTYRRPERAGSWRCRISVEELVGNLDFAVRASLHRRKP